MWIPTNVLDAVNDVARIGYVDGSLCRRWNQQRREGELRLMTGWYWESRTARKFRQGFKTRSVAYRDCWYELVQQTSAPSFTRGPRLRVVEEPRKKGSA
jgi:hypothetical protein